ncbi:MAG TPA: peptide chain release factor N(5)-glutamine methyltransferase [Geminicoccaceae bacterium]|nr:peptide chain release factor N(5)-glutamine methyltransferase [Geminicoccaceae bacterium]
MSAMQAGADPRRRLADLAAKLAAAGIEDARREAWLLLSAVTGRSRVELIAGAPVALSPEEEERLDALAARRLAREPMAYILGEREFWSLPFRVSPAVLVPRPESESVVEAALESVHGRTTPLRILDLGTGSGCLLLALLSELPNATGLGVDRSAAALAVARGNAGRLGLAARAAFGEGHWGQGLAGPYDLVVSNPPYVARADAATLPPEVRAFEPEEALFAGADGLDAYRALAPDCARLLAEHGVACLEIGQGQAAAVEAVMRRHGLRLVGSRPDLAGIERCLILRPDPPCRDR